MCLYTYNTSACLCAISRCSLLRLPFTPNPLRIVPRAPEELTAPFRNRGRILNDTVVYAQNTVLIKL